MLQGKLIIIIVVAVAGALGGGVLTFSIGIPDSPCNGITGVTRQFTIVVDSTGFNGSGEHQGNWPVMSVHRCDKVRITIINNVVETHGFAIDYYAVRGTEVQPQQPFTFQFQAIKPGQFRVYCNIPCSIHFLMQNGLLIVT